MKKFTIDKNNPLKTKNVVDNKINSQTETISENAKDITKQVETNSETPKEQTEAKADANNNADIINTNDSDTIVDTPVENSSEDTKEDTSKSKKEEIPVKRGRPKGTGRTTVELTQLDLRGNKDYLIKMSDFYGKNGIADYINYLIEKDKKAKANTNSPTRKTKKKV
ncbi:MAG: hypothetical protein MJ231_02185 [bacterium]|nr:hypothetical protein [bacterium]